jgi:hypothetical protein
VEYEIDRAIAALRSGLEINPGPAERVAERYYSPRDTLLIMYERGWIVHEYGTWITVSFPIFESFDIGARDNDEIEVPGLRMVLLDHVAQRSTALMVKWAGSVPAAVARWNNMSPEGVTEFIRTYCRRCPRSWLLWNPTKLD